MIKRGRELVKRLLLALDELVQYQPPCRVRERLEDQVIVFARIQCCNNTQP